jgi:hypothetical protein
MSAYAILRVAKIKHSSKLRRSFDHAFRARETPNADARLTPENTHMGAASPDEAISRFNALMPAKVRKNAVLALEFLITASPEAMQGKSREKQDGYFADALDWLKAKHGAENVFYAGIHRDETTPHMYAYVVPRDERGKLNCRKFYGARDAFSAMQTEFWERVGRPHGLERGLEGSRARHTAIREYYGRVKATEATARSVASVDVPEPSLVERLNPRTYGDRVARSVLEQIGPDWKRMQAKAVETDAAQAGEKQARKALEQLQSQLKPVIDVLRPLNDQERQTLLVVAEHAKEKLLGQRMEKLREQQRELEALRQQQHKAGQDRGWSR